MTNPVRPHDHFGTLTVVGDIGKRSSVGGILWLCKCTRCGRVKFERASRLRRAATCRCLAGLKTKTRMTIHGLTDHPLHEVWHSMLARCGNPKRKDYINYGGRGITVCRDWSEDFTTFYDWAVQNGWESQLQLDRIDNNGDYSPTNCRFVTTMENAHNKRNSRLITINGQTKCASEWERECQVSRTTIVKRLLRGLSGPDLLLPSMRKHTAQV